MSRLRWILLLDNLGRLVPARADEPLPLGAKRFRTEEHARVVAVRLNEGLYAESAASFSAGLTAPEDERLEEPRP